MRPRILLLDLFGTVVHFTARVPVVEVGGAQRRSPMSWLRQSAERLLPQVDFDELLRSLMQVTEEIVRRRPPEYHEVPSSERFHRALERIGVGGDRRSSLARELSLAHMHHLASATELPAHQREVLQALASDYRLGLVSNFDHGATARRILSAHDVTRFFEVVLISEEFGRRKPHPAIFAEALQQLGAGVDEAIFVGDSFADDVAGAHAAGLRVAWISHSPETMAAKERPPDYTITGLADLPPLLQRL
jgi:HAD superfamily hydrolase (TIGR01549 family)